MFFRYTFLTNIPYKESYKYKDVFQIFPNELSLKEESYLGDYHYLNYIEINLIRFYELINSDVKIQNVMQDYKELIEGNNESIDISQIGPLIRREHYKAMPKWIIIRLLSVFTNFLHFDYDEHNLDGWFRKLPPDGSEIEWGKKWIPIYDIEIQSFSTNLFSDIETINDLEYSKSIDEFGGRIKYPKNINTKFDNYFRIPINAREVYTDSVVMFVQARSIRNIQSSLSVVALTSAIENLVNFKHKDIKIDKCDSCGQEKYKVTKKFNDFIKENTLGYYSQKEIKGLIGDIYARRSLIVHKGELFQHEKGNPIWSDKYFDETLVEVGFISLTRYILNYWITNQI